MRRGPALLALALLAFPAGALGTIPEAPWSEGPVADGLPTGEGRHFRVLLQAALPPALAGAADVPVSTAVDLAAALRTAAPKPYPSLPNGQLKGFELDAASLRLVEVDPDRLTPLAAPDDNGRIPPEPMLWSPGSFTDTRAFDARLNPTITVNWILQGPTAGPRAYFLYFDAVHNGHKAAASPDTASVAAAVGPGRGSRHFISLHPPLAGSQATMDPRFLRVTNLQETPVQVDLHRYDHGDPDPLPFDHIDVPAGLGQTATYRLPALDPYEGSALLADAGDALVLVEAASAVTMADSAFTPGTARLFLPATGGGFVGRQFAETPVAGVSWLVYCPGLPVNAQPCRVHLRGSPSQSISLDNFAPFAVTPGAPAVLETDQGLVAVERVPNVRTASNGGLVAWPAMDGPAGRTLFLGHAVATATPPDRLLLGADGPAAVKVRNPAGSNQILADRLEVPAHSFLNEVQGGRWGTGWKRDWRTDDGKAHNLVDGPVTVRALAGSAGLRLVSGLAVQGSGFSFLVPLQSPDGGLSYSATLPGDGPVPVGRLALFALHDGTSVRLQGVPPAGGAPMQRLLVSLRAGQFVPDAATEAGWWTVEADRPVVLLWQEVGSTAFSAFAPGATDVADVRVLGAQASGYLFDLQPPSSFTPVRPGGRVEFTVPVRNLASAVDGAGARDRVLLSAKVPPGWPPAIVVPSTLDLEPFGDASVTVKVDVPGSVDASTGGATVVLQGASVHAPALRIEADLRISFVVQRGVQLTADGTPGELEKRLAPHEAASILVQVTNTGSVPDAFQLQHALPPGGWELNATCLFPPPCLEQGEGKTPLLGPGASAQLFLQFTPDANAPRLVTRILATSLSDPSVAASLRLVTALATDRQFALEVDEPTQVVPPGGQAVFLVRLRNLAEGEEELRLDLQSQRPEGWEPPAVRVTLAGSGEGPTDLASLKGLVSIPPAGVALLELTQRVPPGAPPHQVAFNRLLGESNIDASGASSEAPLRTVVREVRGVSLQAPTELTATPDTTVPFPVELASSGNGEQEVRLRVQGPGAGWRVLLDGSPNATVRLAAGQKATVPLQLAVPRDARPLEAGGNLVLLRAEVAGAPAAVAGTLVQVASVPSLAVAAGPWALQRGRATPVAATLENTGNVDLQLTATVSHAQLGEQVAQVRLPRGGRQEVAFNLTAPPNLPDGTARLTVRSSGGLERRLDVPFSSGVPVLGAQLEGMEDLGGGLSVLRVRVENRGNAAATGVWVAATRDGEQLDRLPLGLIRPGANQTVNLVVDTQSGLQVQVVADHDPEGLWLPVADAARGAPVPPAAAVAVLLLALAARRRRR